MNALPVPFLVSLLENSAENTMEGGSDSRKISQE
jgi:hypothetical protein